MNSGLKKKIVPRWWTKKYSKYFRRQMEEFTESEQNVLNLLEEIASKPHFTVASASVRYIHTSDKVQIISVKSKALHVQNTVNGVKIQSDLPISEDFSNFICKKMDDMIESYCHILERGMFENTIHGIDSPMRKFVEME